MGLPVTVFQSTDAGAPQIVEAKVSEVIEVLRKCLVDGYGSKPGLGWSVAFENPAAFKIIFRNSTADGSGGYCKVFSHDDTDSTVKITIDCGSGAIDADTLINPHGYRQFALEHYYQGNARLAFNWEVIGTSRAVWFIMYCHYQAYDKYYMNASSQQYQNNIFFGDIDSATPNDAGAFTLVNGYNSLVDYTSVSYSAKIGGVSGWFTNLYPTDLSSSDKVTHFAGGITRYLTNNIPGTANSLSMSHILTPMSISKTNKAYGQLDNTASPMGRGIVPGTYLSSLSAYSDQDVPVTENIGGSNYRLLRTYHTPCVWINLEEWYV